MAYASTDYCRSMFRLLRRVTDQKVFSGLEHFAIQVVSVKWACRHQVPSFVPFESSADPSSLVILLSFVSFDPRLQTSNFVHQELGLSIGFKADSVATTRLTAASAVRSSSTRAPSI